MNAFDLLARALYMAKAYQATAATAEVDEDGEITIAWRAGPDHCSVSIGRDGGIVWSMLVGTDVRSGHAAPPIEQLPLTFVIALGLFGETQQKHEGRY